MNQPHLSSYLQYNDPNVAIIRTGQVGDEYVNRNDNLPVVQGKITLLEIPSYRYGIKINGFIEIDQDYYNRTQHIAENEILVYYPSGIIMFNPIHEGKTFLVNYEGRGVILLSADRVYMMYQKDPSVLVTLTDFANEIKSQLKLVNQRIKKYEEVADYTLKIAEEARTATDQSRDATYHSIIATQNAIDAADSSVIKYQNPVISYSDLATTYPNPENGYWVQIISTGEIFRYDAIKTRSWRRIGELSGGTIPFVSEDTDGIMRKEDYVKFIERSFGAALGSIIQTGVQQPTIRIPYNAYINKVYAYATDNQSTFPIEIAVEKIAANEFPDGVWQNILENNIFFLNSSNLSTQPEVIDEHKIINEGDYFRFNLINLGGAIKGVTVQFEVKQL